jgi:UDP-N-acetylmuramoylalanine--D-glutamate ligase
MELKGKKVLVVGLGKTGEAVCRFLLRQGARVKVSEKTVPEKLAEKAEKWGKKGVAVEAGGHRQKSFLEAELIVLSPGVPYLPELEAARREGKEIISEIELAFRFLRGKIVGITGTNGKSTTATLTHKILQGGGLRSHLVGNIGDPLIRFAAKSRPDDIFVTELSSFQLRYIELFRASVSVFLNISPDHLDWHTSFEDYFSAKKNLILGQKKGDVAILNRDDPRIWALRKSRDFEVFAFSQRGKVSRGCWLDGNWLSLADRSQEKLIKLKEIPLGGIHNRENIMASALVGHVLGIPVSSLKKSIQGFRGLEHRLEKVLDLGGVVFYNDSKATNVDASLKSIQSFSDPIVLLLGGRDKGGDFDLLRKPVREKVKTIILIGEAADKIAKSLNGTVPLQKASNLKEAVGLAYSAAAPAGIVLLAPACTSFDMFKNFEERGKIFKKEVRALQKRVEGKKE